MYAYGMLQVITGADFHPSHCNLFAFSSSKGSIRVADMRSSALCDKSARSYEEAQATVRQQPRWQRDASFQVHLDSNCAKQKSGNMTLRLHKQGVIEQHQAS